MRRTAPIGRTRNAFDRSKISELLEKVLADIGFKRFAGMRLLELERVVRTYDPERGLPGKTVLRAEINGFRNARWPTTTPKGASVRRF
jgi:hypothetical protein